MPSSAVALAATIRPVRVMVNSFNARASPQRLEGIYPVGRMPKPAASVALMFMPMSPAGHGRHEIAELDLGTLIERGQQLDPTLVAPAFELSGQEDAQRRNCRRRISGALAKAGDVRVIVPTGHLGVPVIANNARADTSNLVRSHADALAAAADQYAEVSIPGGDHLADLRAEDRVVDAFIAVGAAVADVVALRLEPFLQS